MQLFSAHFTQRENGPADEDLQSCTHRPTLSTSHSWIIMLALFTE